VRSRGDLPDTVRVLRKFAVLGFFIAVTGVTLRPTPAGARLEEDFALRGLFAVRGPVDPPPGVVVVSIDRTSADQLGLRRDEWPPPRHVHAAVIRRLAREGASVIVMDVFFRVRRTPAEDEDLAAAMAESGQVVLFERVDRLRYASGEIVVQNRSPIGPLREAAAATAVFPLPEGAAVTFFWTFFDTTGGTVPTLPAVALHMKARPHLNPLFAVLREAGVHTRADPALDFRTVRDSSRVMTVLRRDLRRQPDRLRRALDLLKRDDGVTLPSGERRLLTSLVRLYAGDDMRYLNFYGPPGRIRTIPFHDLLADQDDSRIDVNGAVVFVGEGASPLLSSAAQPDTYRTVYSVDGANLSGAEIAATAYANLLTDRTLRRVRLGAEIAILIVLAFVFAGLARSLAGLRGVAAILLVSSAYYGLVQYLFARPAVLLPLGIPLLVQAPLALFLGVLFRYRSVQRQVPREVDHGVSPEIAHGVCLSTDIENYMTAAAGMEPRALADLMGEYFETLSKLVKRRGGVVVGRAGDSAMCVWTAPAKRPWLTAVSRQGGISRDSVAAVCANACEAALAIRETVASFNARHATPLRTRIGLHAGDVALGLVGGEYHVVGDVPNTASRIQGLNKHMGTTILASEGVVQDQPGLLVRPLGSFLLSGRLSPVAIAEVVGPIRQADPALRDLCGRFADALAVFTSGELAAAAERFDALASAYPSDGPTRYYQHLCSGRSSLVLSAGGRSVVRVDVK
jgi:adenylate cyclase